jgi:hypothetical protein
MKTRYQLTAGFGAAIWFLTLIGCPTAYNELKSHEDMIGELAAVMEAEDGILSCIPQSGRELDPGELPMVASSSAASGGKYVKNISLDIGYLEVAVPEGTAEGYYTLWLRYSGSKTGTVTVTVNPDPGKDKSVVTAYPGYDSRPVLNTENPEKDDWVMAKPKYLAAIAFAKFKAGDVLRLRNRDGSIHIDAVYLAMPKDVKIQIEAEDFTPVPNPLNTTNPIVVDYTNNPGKESFGVRHASEGKWIDYGRIYSATADNSDPQDEGFFEYTLPANFPGNKYTVQLRYGSKESWPTNTRLAMRVKKPGEALYGAAFVSNPVFPNGSSNGTVWWFNEKAWFSLLMDSVDPEKTGKPELAAGDTLKLYTLNGRAFIDYLVFTPSGN